MANSNKPIDYIICEGPSDAEFLSLYIERSFNYSFNKGMSHQYSSSIVNSKFIYEVGATRDSLIIASGGCSNISAIYNEIVLPGIKTRDIDARIIVVIDRDNKSDSECYDLVPFSDTPMTINQWNNGTMNGLFIQPDGTANTIKWKTYFSVIPESGFGAFENVLINAILNSEPAIGNEVSAFFDSLSPNAKAHINSNRKEIKAKLDSMIVLLDPEKIFLSLKQLFSAINLADSNIVNNYGFLMDITNNF